MRLTNLSAWLPLLIICAIILATVPCASAQMTVGGNPATPNTAIAPDPVVASNAEDLVYFGLSSAIVVLSLVSLVVVGLRRRNIDAAQLTFGCLSLAIGLSFLFGTSAFRSLVGGSPDLWQLGQSALWYLLTMSAFAFVHCFAGPGWRSLLRWVAWGYFAYASIALVLMLVLSGGKSFHIPNNFAVTLSLLAVLVNALRPEWRRQTRQRILAVFCIGSIQYFVFDSLLYLNMISLDIVAGWSRGLIFYSTLGIMTVAVYYFFAREEKLAAVRQELKTARQIQTSILPKSLPDVPGLDIATRYVPMTEVAGDFYDFVSVDKSRLGILVADVSGHGVSAALIASMVKVAFLAQADRASNPADVLTGLNHVFSGQLEGQYITAGYTFLDIGEGYIHCAGAAHPPLLIRPAGGGDILTLDENGLMLGPFSDATYTTVSHRLTPGDRIVMYTDGITEAQNSKGEQYGEARFHRLLIESQELGANAFADRLLADVETWSGSRPGDDLTVVVVDYQPSASPS